MLLLQQQQPITLRGSSFTEMNEQAPALLSLSLIKYVIKVSECEQDIES